MRSLNALVGKKGAAASGALATATTQRRWFENQEGPGRYTEWEKSRVEGEAKTGYTKSADGFKDRVVLLDRSYSGETEKMEITFWEDIWWNYWCYAFTRESLIGKDRFGNRFTRRWHFLRDRHEERRCYRVDHNKRHQPYGCLPTDCRQWEAWMRNWRHDPPTPEEQDEYRKRKQYKMGVHALGDEEPEDTIVRSLATTIQAPSLLAELDPDEKYATFMQKRAGKEPSGGETSQEELDKHKMTPKKKGKSSWTVGFVRGDLFYNEEEVEAMRNSLSHVFRDREWQYLEMKRQIGNNKPGSRQKPVNKPTGFEEDEEGQPVDHYWDRPDNFVPYQEGVMDLKTPEIEKLKIEMDELEESRLAMRKELGLTNLGDEREGRNAIDKGYAPFQPPPVTSRWKPKVWSESWGMDRHCQ